MINSAALSFFSIQLFIYTISSLEEKLSEISLQEKHKHTA